MAIYGAWMFLEVSKCATTCDKLVYCYHVVWHEYEFGRLSSWVPFWNSDKKGRIRTQTIFDFIYWILPFNLNKNYKLEVNFGGTLTSVHKAVGNMWLKPYILSFHYLLTYVEVKEILQWCYAFEIRRRKKHYVYSPP